jgi:hypothetical protein
MKTSSRNKNRLTLAAPGAAFVGLLAYFFSHGTALAPKSVTEPVQAKKIPVASNIKPKKQQKKVRVANNTKTPASTRTSVLQATPVLFPKPTEITIAVAAAPQLVKMDSYQNPLDTDAKKWDCVKDGATDLVWEVKTHDRGLQDANNFYSWYSSPLNRVTSGTKNNGKCRGGINCDTQSYVNAINAKRVCGYSDWRLPSRKELLSLVRNTSGSEQNTTIDTRYFPSTPGDWYWTADTDLGDSDHAWYVLFYNGRTMKALKSQAKRVRLVRGGKEQRRSFKDMAKQKGPESSKEIAKQPFEPESSATAKKEMLSQN